MTLNEVTGLATALCAAAALACSLRWRTEAASRSTGTETDSIAQAFADLMEDARSREHQAVSGDTTRIEAGDDTVRVSSAHGTAIRHLRERIRRLRKGHGKRLARDVERLTCYADKATLAVAKWDERNALVADGRGESFERREAFRQASCLSDEANRARQALNGE